MAATNNIDASPPAVIPTIASVPPSNQTTPHREIVQEPASCAENSSNRKAGPRRVQLITLSTTPQNVGATNTTQQKTSDTSTSNSSPASTADTIVIL